MSDARREELISAYLDNELSSEERREVEAWLAESADARKMLEDLRGLSSDLKSLPQYRVERDLAGEVLRQSERTVLAGPARQVAVAAPSVRMESTPAPRGWNRGAGWRRLAWPAVAAAAALVILIYNSFEDAQQQVALAPDETTTPAQVSGPATSLQAPDKQDELSRSRGALRNDPTVGRYGSAPVERLEKQKEMPAPATPPQASAGEDQVGGDLKDSSPALNTVQPKRQSQLATQSAVVGEVSAEFIREGRFEKLLDSRKIVWQRLSDDDRAANKDPLNVGTPLNQLQSVAGTPHIVYAVKAEPQQVADVISALRKDSGEVKIVRDQSVRSTNRANIKVQPGEETLFYFSMPAGDPKSAPAAAPPPADAKP